MKKERKTIELARLQLNEGQIPGVPSNPRQWTQDEIDRLAKSLRETPELFQARPLIVYPLDDYFVVLCGNLRLTASKQNGETKVPCIVIPAEIPAAKLKEIVIKDNGDFGDWDYELLEYDWDDFDLSEFGINPPKAADYSGLNTEINPGDFDDTITLRLKYDKVLGSRVKTALGEDPKTTMLNALNYGNQED